MANYTKLEAQAMPVNTATGSRSSSLASLFSQGTTNDVQIPDNSKTKMGAAPDDTHEISKSPSSMIGAVSLSSPRDSGYATSNDIYEARPADGPTTSQEAEHSNGNIATQDQEYNGGDDEATNDEDLSDGDSSDEEVEEYEPFDDRLAAERRLIEAGRLREQFAFYKTPESRRRAIKNTLRRAARDESLQNILWTYFYQHPEDIPHNPALERRRDAATALRAGYVDFMMEGCEDAEEELIIEERQQELFGDWNWPRGKFGAESSVKKGPKGENLLVRADPPRGCTWASLREEQQRKLEEFRGKQQQQDQRHEH